MIKINDFCQPIYVKCKHTNNHAEQKSEIYIK